MRTKYADCARPLICLPMEDDRHCTLMEDWHVAVDGMDLTVPADTRTDGASIPRWLWRVCGHPLEVPRIYAATVHDWLYGGAAEGVTRAEADHVYYQLLRHFGASWAVAKTEYYALRLCGWSHWLSMFTF